VYFLPAGGREKVIKIRHFSNETAIVKIIKKYGVIYLGFLSLPTAREKYINEYAFCK
jgi:hypothetical protein